VKRVISILILTAIFVNGAFAQENSAAAEPTPDLSGFKSDGCTFFPDGNYRNCCEAHDREYFVGGSRKERRRSDAKLFRCVWAKPKFYNKLVAPVMWLGVRVGGVPCLKTGFSWGFGKRKKSADKKSKQKKRDEKLSQ